MNGPAKAKASAKAGRSAKASGSGGGGGTGKAAPPGRGPGAWRAATAVLGCLVVAGGVVAAIVLTREPPPGPDPERVAELEASEDAQNVTQIGELIDQTRTAHDDLVPVLEGLDTALPAEGAPPSDGPGGDEVADWRSTVDDVAAGFATSPSGDTGHNVARGGLRSAVELLASSVEVYQSAEAADGDQRDRLLELAADLRTQAVRAWSVAATQLDVVAVEAGHGHVHIFLPAQPGSEALIPDSAPEGTDAREEPTS
ncbi:hypothetical protein ACFO4E_17015 [Nocardiopsis mangrovi]|uniref:Secreted protein n=1 Tax=Nocardiopsis mangrovi TaxID=1179818 RepID=A0ABV9DXM3_9ACTN